MALLDVLLIVASTETDDEGVPYAVTRVFRYDVEEHRRNELEQLVESVAVEGGKMRNT